MNEIVADSWNSLQDHLFADSWDAGIGHFSLVLHFAVCLKLIIRWRPH